MPGGRWGRNTVVKFIGGELVIRDDVQVLAHAARQFEYMAIRGRDLTPVFAQQRKRFQDAAELQFRQEGWPTKWPALTPAYAAWKAKHYPGKTIMRRSDRLYLSLVSETPDSIWRVNRQSIQYGTRVPYWREHQFGTARLPARPTVRLDPYTLSFIGDDVMEWILAADTVTVPHGRILAMIKRLLGPAEAYIESFIRR